MRQLGAEGHHRRQLIAGLVLAAGQSTRFGRQKLLERWQGQPLVARAARTFIEAGLSPVIVVVSADKAFCDALAGLSVTTVVNPQPGRGISSSIRLGVAALPEENTATLIGVADQPYITADAIVAVVRAVTPRGIVVPRYGDHRGNPVVFDRAYFAELASLDGDRGGQRVVAAHPEAVTEVELPAAMGEDVDRPEQWRD